LTSACKAQSFIVGVLKSRFSSIPGGNSFPKASLKKHTYHL
jgi:hypothetical protein